MSDSLHTLRRQSGDSASAPNQKPPKKKSFLPSLAKSLPWLLMAGFAFLVWLLFGDRFETGRELDMVQVVTVRSQDTVSVEQVDQAADRDPDALNFDGPTLFQASGWVEPDPLLIRATALYSGVVDKVHVLEGERVQKGQLLATMVDEDAQLDLQTAEAQLAEAEARFAQAKTTILAQEAFLESKLREVTAAEARLDELKDEAERLEKAGRDVFRESQISQARLRVQSQAALVEATRAKVNEARAQLSNSQAARDFTQANLKKAQAEVARRQLAMDRTRIYSPVNGRIQKLYAAPGKKRILNMDGPESATIATLYEPESLQARIDVPLEEAAQLIIGQPVRLRSTLLPDRVFEGQVTRIDGEADLQRNTLQAKVKILNPADELRPEMLCRAEFLPLPKANEAGRSRSARASGRVALYVPETSLINSENSAWALDKTGKFIERRELQLGQERRDGHLLVIEGLRPGDWVVNNPPADLEAGERVKNAKR